MSVLADVQAYNLTFAQQLAHAQHGEGETEIETTTIFFERLSNANAPTQSAGIDDFKFYDRAYDGTQLPPEEKYEIRIPEGKLQAADLLRVVALTLLTPFSTKRFSIVRQDEPFAEIRLWRLGVFPAEDQE